jgi:aminomethyltransferase
MKNTPLTEKHLALGAKMAEFAGYNMPIVYTGIIEEHMNIRNGVGVFDVSHMGEFIVRGKEALQFLQKVTSNDVSKLNIGDVQYSCLPNKSGGIVDDLLVYRLPEDQCAEGEMAFMLVVNASNIEKDWSWLEENKNFDVQMINISDQTGLIAVQGPKSVEILQSLCDVDLSAIKYYSFKKGTFAGVDNVIISATGYTGSGGFELYADATHIAKIWDAVFEAGKTNDIQAAGLGCRDTLRLEMGFCLYGNDINDTTSPLEAGLGWITKLGKGDFNSADIFRKQKENGLVRKLVGFEMEEKRVPRHDYRIFSTEGKDIGIVTSGTMSPSLGKPIGMGYVLKEYASEGTQIQIEVGKKLMSASVVKIPFLKKV